MSTGFASSPRSLVAISIADDERIARLGRALLGLSRELASARRELAALRRENARLQAAAQAVEGEERRLS